MAYYRLARGMLHSDRIVLALLFTKIYLRGFTVQKSSGDTINLEAEFRSLMVPYKTGIVGGIGQGANGLSSDENEALTHLGKMPAFRSLENNILANQVTLSLDFGDVLLFIFDSPRQAKTLILVEIKTSRSVN